MNKYFYFLFTLVLSFTTLNFSALAAVPANDNVSSAINLAAGTIGEVTGTNSEATIEPSEPNHFGPYAPLRTVWYKWTATENISMSFQLTDNFKSIMAVYRDVGPQNISFGDMDAVASNWDSYSFDPTTNRVTFFAIAGRQYYIVVSGQETAPNDGTFTLKYAPHHFRYSGKFNGFQQKTVVMVFRPSEGNWYNASSGVRHLGSVGDKPYMADHDGNNIADFTVVRNENNQKLWYVNDSNSFSYQLKAVWGLATDQDAIGDFDADGKADLVAIRNNGQNLIWYVRRSRDGAMMVFNWGLPTDKPVIGDFDGDRSTDVAVTRIESGKKVWYILKSGNGLATPPYSQFLAAQFGLDTDIATVEDYDGDLKSDIAVFRGSTGTWYVLKSGTGELTAMQVGADGDIPQPGDYDGDGKADAAVFSTDGFWSFLYSGTNTRTTTDWGMAGDIPVAAINR